MLTRQGMGTMRPRVSLSFVCILLSVLLQTASAGLGKQAAITIDRFTPVCLVSNPWYVLSLVCLGLQAVTWQLALRQYALSFAYFFLSLVYVNILILSRLVFHEDISMANLLGSGLIVAGVVLLTREGGEPGDA